CGHPTPTFLVRRDAQADSQDRDPVLAAAWDGGGTVVLGLAQQSFGWLPNRWTGKAREVVPVSFRGALSLGRGQWSTPDLSKRSRSVTYRGQNYGCGLRWGPLVSGVFVNYRGEDSDTAAVLIDRELAARLGSDRVFLDSRSIPAGADFAEVLLGRLRAC